MYLVNHALRGEMGNHRLFGGGLCIHEQLLQRFVISLKVTDIDAEFYHASLLRIFATFSQERY